MGQHLVEIAQHPLQEFALGTGVYQREQHFAEGAPVLEKETRQNGHDDQQPCFLGNVRHAQADTLGQAEKVIAVAGQKSRELYPGMYAPPLLLADLFGNLAGTDGLQKLGQRLAQTLPLARNFRPNEEEESDQQNHQQQINQAIARPRPRTSFSMRETAGSTR